MPLQMLETLRKNNGGGAIVAVLYARYSSDMQREESIEAQVKAIKEFAAKENIIIKKQYIDKALTGTTDARPRFQQMIADSKLKSFQLVLVHKTDRFSRNTYNSIVYRHILRTNGVRFLAVAQPLDDDKPEDKLLDILLTGVASYYSDNLRGEVLKGLRINAEKALHTGGIPPLGYEVGKDKHLVLNEKEAEAVRIIFEMTIAGNKYSEIIHKLRINGYKTKAGKEFGKNSLNAILHNRKYVGDFIYNRTVSKDPETHKRNSHKERPIDEQIIVQNAIPAIISREEFEKVQDILLKRKVFARASKSVYLLTGKIFCGVCNCSYTGNVKLPNKKHRLRNPTYSYRCNNRSRRIDESVCDNKEINRDCLESYVLSKIEEFIFNPETITSVMQKFKEYISKMNTEKNDTLNTLKINIELQKQQIKRLTDKYIATDNPILQKEIDERIRDIDRNITEATLAYENEKASMNITVPSKRKLESYINTAKEQYKTKTLDELHDLIQLIVDKIVVYKDSVVITLNLIPGMDSKEFMKTHLTVSRDELSSKTNK